MAFKVTLPTLWIGSAFKHVFLWYYEDPDGGRTPIDLTGKNGRLEIRSAPGDEVYGVWSTENGLLTFEGNKISIQVPRSKSLEYSFDTASWDLLIWPLNDTESAEVLMYGDINGRRTITEIV